jgi:hypothetical protein
MKRFTVAGFPLASVALIFIYVCLPSQDDE